MQTIGNVKLYVEEEEILRGAGEVNSFQVNLSPSTERISRGTL